MAELVDAHDSKSCFARSESSILSSPTKKNDKKKCKFISLYFVKKSSTKLFILFNCIIWWAKRESNSHFLRNTILSRARLPVPPFALIV